METTHYDWGKEHTLYSDSKRHIRIYETNQNSMIRVYGPFKTIKMVHYLLKGEMKYFYGKDE